MVFEIIGEVGAVDVVAQLRWQVRDIWHVGEMLSVRVDDFQESRLLSTTD